jgi:restriction system protein
MSIPKHNEIRIPVLNFLKEHGDSSSKDMLMSLSKHFGLSEEELTQMYESGNGPIFKDRISWALTYLGFTDLIERPKRGIYRISQKGLDMLLTPEKIDVYVDHFASLRIAQKKNKVGELAEISQDENSNHTSLTPAESVYQSFQKLKKAKMDEVLETILRKEAFEFEKLVVWLLQKMGYGGEIKESGTVTQRSNDRGIDGIIKEDILGFGKIYIQAKRYARDKSIGREELQKFVGALAVAQSNKGVFITTSSFRSTAVEYVNSLNSSATIVLIDGDQLAEYIYDYDLGMQTEKVFTIKGLDNDFWDELIDEKV